MSSLARPGGRPLRLLSVYHSAVVGEYRRRFAPLLAPGDVSLDLLCPAAWTQFNRWQEAPPLDPGLAALGARLHLIQPWGSWLPTPTLRNVFHFYPGQEARVRALAPDLIEVWEEPYSLAALQLVRIARRLDPRPRVAVFSAQNLYKARPWPIAGLEREVLAGADLMLPVTAEVEAVLRRKGYAGPAVILPLGLDPDEFRPGPGPAPSPGPAGPVIGFVGKLQPEKGVYVLLDAFSRLPPGPTLLLAGAGPERAGLEARARRAGILDRVRFAGPRAHGEMAALYRGLDLLVVPSLTTPGWKEQFGRVVIEGMASGVPVIGSSSGEIPAVVGEAGEIVPEGDPAALAAILAALLADPGRRARLAGLGRARVEATFSWAAIAARQREAYAALMARPA